MSKHPPIIIRDDTLRRRVIGMIERLDLSKGWEVVIQPHKRRRSLSQNALYWAWLEEVVTAVRAHTGCDRDDIHEAFKRKFLPARIVDVMGEPIAKRTTTTLTPAEMTAYLDAIYAYVTGDLGICLPLPSEFADDRRAA